MGRTGCGGRHYSRVASKRQSHLRGIKRPDPALANMTTMSETFRVVSKRALDGFPSRISHAHASCDPAKSYSQLVCSGITFGGMWSVSPGSPRGGRTMLMMVPACSWVGWIGLPYASARRLEAAWKRARKSALPSGFVAVRPSKYAPRQRLVMELVGLEPTTSWVRFAQTSVARSSFALVGRCEVRSVLPSSLGLVARLVARMLPLWATSSSDAVARPLREL